MLSTIKWLFGWNSPEPQQQVTRHKMELKPITPFLTPYISIDDWNKGFDKQLGKKLGWLNKTKSELQNTLKQHNQYPPKLLALPKEIGESNRQQAIIISLINGYSNDIYNTKKSSLEEAIQYVNEMEIFATDINEKHYPIWIDMNEFIQTVKNYSICADEIADLTIKKQRLEKILKPCQLPHKMDASQLIESIKQAISKYQSEINFIQENQFDNDLTDYINDAPIKQQFDQVLERISDFNHDIAMNQLKNAIDNLFSQVIKPKISNLNNDDRHAIYNILMYASVRYTFNRVCVELPYILHNSLSAKAFLRNCVVIRRLSPRALSQRGREKEGEHVFLPTQFRRPIEDFFMEDELLKNAVTSLNLVQFFSNPVDIAYLCSAAIELLKRFIVRNTIANRRYGGDATAVTEADMGAAAQEMLCFDELFTVFYMALCVCPPANIVAISVFIRSFSHFLTQSGVLEYGSTSIRAAVDYINEFDINAVTGEGD